jgi:thiol-disulfide isomerase/thioredoxin
MCSNGVMREDRCSGRYGWGSLCGIAIGLAILATGCGGNERPAAPGARPAVTAVPIDLVDHAGLLERVAAHRGKVVVLDCWSTSCPPCIKEFPGLVALAAAHPDDVVCLSLAFDYEGIGTPAEVLPPVQKFLATMDDGHLANLHHLLGREDADAMYRKLELDSVPAVFVWRADGTLARRFDDDDAARRLGRAFTYDDVAETVREALTPGAESAGTKAAGTLPQ